MMWSPTMPATEQCTEKMRDAEIVRLKEELVAMKEELRHTKTERDAAVFARNATDKTERLVAAEACVDWLDRYVSGLCPSMQDARQRLTEWRTQ